MTLEQKIAKRVSKARTQLLLHQPWWGALCMRLNIEGKPLEWWEKHPIPMGGNKAVVMPTLATDGTNLFYYAEFVDTLTDPQLQAIFAHETMHCALLHPYRRGHRNPLGWNVATDLAINLELKKAGFELPPDVLYDPSVEGLSSEVIYARLKDLSDKCKKQGQTGKSTGSIIDPDGGPSSQSDAQKMTEEDWKMAAEQATQAAKMAGKIPAFLEETVRRSRESVQDWKSLLREFIKQTIPSDYSWQHPNRRFVAQDIYLPGMLKEGVGPIAVVVDTSGSVSSQMLAAVCSEINAIASEVHPEKITVLYCDAQVHKTEVFEPYEEVILHAAGRGGTAFQPAFDAIEKHEEQPVCCLYMTDLESSDVPKEPPYPTLWVVDKRCTLKGPFGQTIQVDLEM